MPEQPAKPYYLTTPIYYVNARPHIGHAYSTIVADVLARRHRLLRGSEGAEDVFFLTGTDEHGQKIERAAAAAGIPPQQYADQVSKTFSDLWHRMGITHNQFIRTTDPHHKRGVQKLFTDLYEKGQIYLSSYTGQYSVGEEMFVEGPPGTIGPDGRPTETVTEENFFFRLSDYQLPLLNLITSNELLITPTSSRNEVLRFLEGPALETAWAYVTKRDKRAEDEVSFSDEEEAFKDGILGRVEEFRPDETKQYRYYIPGALRDLSISRSSFTWGIPVPEEIQAKEKTKEKHVIYVWLDALANYMTALGYGSADDTLWQKFWPADLHLVGKEITRFHCVYWPAFLLALNPKMQHAKDEPAPILSPAEHTEWAKKWLPKQVTANGWLLFDNSKMSKSKGNVVRTETILDAFGTLCPPPPKPSALTTDQVPSALTTDQVPQGFSLGSHISGKKEGALAPGGEPTKKDRDLFAADVLRYYLLREIPFGQDGTFSFDAMITRYNADLANGYGNLVSRTLTMVSKTSYGVIEDCPEAHSLVFYQAQRIETPSQLERQEILSASEGQVLGWAMTKAVDAFVRYMDRLAPTDALAASARAIAAVDAFMTSRKPWAATDTELSQAGRRSTLYTAAESIRIITALLYPILPYATAKVWHQLGLGDIGLAAKSGDLKNLEWGGLQPGTKLGPLTPIFPRADKGLAQIMTDMENPAIPATPTSRPEAPLKSAMTPAPPAPIPASTFDPAAGPRTASIPETGALTVGGSTATTTHNGPTPSHTEAHASGIFAPPPPRRPSLHRNHHRRLRKNRPPRRPDRSLRAHPQGRQAPPPRSRPRPPRPAPDPLRHRRVLHPRRARRPPHRRHHQPRPPQDARPRVPRHAPRRLRRRPRQTPPGYLRR